MAEVQQSLGNEVRERGLWDVKGFIDHCKHVAVCEEKDRQTPHRNRKTHKQRHIERQKETDRQTDEKGGLIRHLGP